MKSYLKFLSRNKLYTAIEAVGLIVSLAFVILIGTSIRDQLGIVKSVHGHERLYLAGPNGTGGEYSVQEALASIPQIEQMAAFTVLQGMLQIGGDNRNVSFGLMDPALLQLIPLAVEGGAADPFAGGEGLAITASAARRFFPDRDPVGQTVGYLEGAGSTPVPATITAVLEDPSYTILGDFDFAVSLQSRLSPLATEVRESDLWNRGFGMTALLFARLYPGAEADDAEMCKLIAEETALNRSDLDAPMLIPYDEVYLSGQGYAALRQGKKVYLSVLVALVILLLISALLSYVNLSLAVTGDRAKEMATRRLVGEDRGKVLRRVLGESLVFTLACYVLAIVLAAWIAPGLDSIRPTGLNVPFHLRLDGGFWLLSAGLVLLLGLLSGLAPAVACASYRPLDVVSGKIRRKRKMVFGNLCIVLQGVLAVVLIVMAITMDRQLRFILKADLGADLQENLYYFSSPVVMGGDAMLPLARQISSSPLVEEIGYTSGYPTFNQLITAGKHEDLLKISCDAVAFEMLGFRVAERFAQVEGSVMLSRSAANAHGITRENASPAAVYWGYENNPEDYPSVVGGIVEDFRTEPVNSSRHREGVPIVEVSSAGVPPKYIGAFLIRTGPDHRAFEEWFRPMVNAWHKEETGMSDVFNLKRAHNGYIEDLIAADHEDMRRYVRLVEVFCLISVLLALLALVAMSSHYADANAKSIAIRKVFGGTIGTETRRGVWTYMLWIGISLLIAIPLAVLVCERFLQNYAEHITGYWWIFVAAALLTILLSLASVLWQTLKAARTNPAIELKKE